MFLNPPMDPAGRKVDVSDRLLICSSSNMRNEVVVGGSDHALYSINVSDSTSKPITMHNKSNGHSDWVTSVTHLADGQVLSGAMDGKLCLWSQRNRSQCIELNRDSIHPISKVVSDARYNLAMSCSYDGNIAVWMFNEDYQPAEAKSGPRSSAVRATAAPMGPVPHSYLSAHTEPVMECGYRDNTFVSGDKGGSMIIWDLSRGQPKHKFRAHPGPITAIDCMEDRNTFITCGTDGFVKIWDPRAAGSGLVAKIPAHVTNAPPAQSRGPVAGPGRGTIGGRVTIAGSRSTAVVSGSRATGGSSSAGRGVVGRTGPSSGSAAPASAPAGASCAISCMAMTSSRGSSSDASYIITGSGSPQDSSLVVMDLRQGAKPVSRWDHHRNGVYSLCLVGDQCVFSGDGMGTLLCHHLLESELDYPRSCLKYGIGASEVGAVRAINCLNGKVVAAGEDGNVMIYDYDA
eukprot:CAMPEP_0184985178 /NCGR_PEP_ID=MMETSP1098-20130426/13979_1 /TAXON_ID=89044 /ORGANISM="Spumella elongata, Strain CCAP 955/1" /LENGTH=458 /DNA_ID=CAMNT_0027509255 /DNA_START=1 /DNA_END=1373 /DNA_ORIENTATION=-